MGIKRFYFLDLTRFICALMVVFFHYFYRIGELSGMPFRVNIIFPAISYIAKYGFLGVHLFFLISGFVILNSALHKSTAGFLRARIIRLYPAYWVCCTLTFLFILFFSLHYQLPIKTYLMNLTMIENMLGIEEVDGVYWTLKYEITFYFWIAVFILLRQIKNIEIILFAWVSLAFLYGIYGHYYYWLESVLLLKFICFFALGSLLYLGLIRGFSNLRVVFILMSLRLAFSEIKERVEGYNSGNFRKENFISPLTSYGIFLVLLIFLYIGLKSNLSVKDRKIWVLLGSLTYPLYLLHQNIGAVIMERWLGEEHKYLFVFALIISMVFIAGLIHLFMERPVKYLLLKVF